MLTCSQTSKSRSPGIALLLYGPGYSEIWTDQPPTPAEVTAWIQEQKKGWSVRTLAHSKSISEVTTWARSQGLKRLDWDFTPKKNIWFKDPYVAMIWDLTCG